MRITKLFPYEIKEQTRCVSIICDLCHATGFPGHPEDRWSKESYDIADTLPLKLKTGFSAPDGGSGEEFSVEICAHCFTTKLVPWLKTMGVEPRKTEWDF